MRVRLAPNIASRVEGLRVALDYPNLSVTTNLLLDAIRHQWDLRLDNLSTPEIAETRIKLDIRHIDWITLYGQERGINAPSATNLIIADHFRNGLSKIWTEKPKLGQANQKLVRDDLKLTEPSQNLEKLGTLNQDLVGDNQELPQTKQKGTQLLRNLKI